jgi:hypothetical protein
MRRCDRLRLVERARRHRRIGTRVVLEIERRATNATMSALRDGRRPEDHGCASPRKDVIFEPDKRGETAAGPTPAHATVTMMDGAWRRTARPADGAAQAATSQDVSRHASPRYAPAAQPGFPATSSSWFAAASTHPLRRRRSPSHEHRRCGTPWACSPVPRRSQSPRHVPGAGAGARCRQARSRRAPFRPKRRRPACENPLARCAARRSPAGRR